MTQKNIQKVFYRAGYFPAMAQENISLGTVVWPEQKTLHEEETGAGVAHIMYDLNKAFQHVSYRKSKKWPLQNLSSIIKKLKEVEKDPIKYGLEFEEAHFCLTSMQQYRERRQTKPWIVAHGDLQRRNILVNKNTYQVTGVIHTGAVHYTRPEIEISYLFPLHGREPGFLRGLISKYTELRDGAFDPVDIVHYDLACDLGKTLLSDNPRRQTDSSLHHRIAKAQTRKKLRTIGI